MDPTHLMTRTGTLTHVTENGAPDEANNPTTTTSTSTVNLYLEPVRTNETDAGGLVVVDALRAFMPPATVVDASDTLTVDGVTYTVDGTPAPWWNPRLQATTHLEVNLRRVS